MVDSESTSQSLIKILIVEESDSAALEMRERVESLGFTVLAATSSWQDAIQIAAKEKPGLVLIETVLDGKPIGLDVAKKLLSRNRVPLIVIAGASDKAMVVNALANGALGFLPKPFSNHALLAAMESAVHAHELQEVALQKEERYALALLGSKDGLWDWNLKTNEIHFSPRWQRMIGYEEGEITTPDQWFDLVYPEDVKNLKGVLDSHIKGFTEHFEMEYRIKNKSNAYTWVSCRGYALRDKNLIPIRIAGLQSDISKIRANQERFIQSALYDTLTNLPSRALFLDHMERVLKIGKRYPDRKFTIFSLETDQHKIIQDTLGHEIADLFILEIASRLKSMLRPGDILARIEADNFMILIEDIRDINYSIRIAERIKKVISLPFSIEGQEINCKVSIGIVIYSPDYNQPEDCLRDAQVALQLARDQGKDRFEIFGKAKHAKIMANIKLEAELRKALERNELTIYYQPIISLHDFKIARFEAFVRWCHPQLGFVPAGEFIKAAEESGLIILMGNWIMENACREMKALHQAGFAHLDIAVNLSPIQLKQKSLMNEIRTILKKVGLEPGHLHLELSEMVVMDNAESNVELLKALNQLGVRLTMDDFGTGYSSLAYLKRFPFSHLKIDLTIVRDIPFSEEAVSVANAIIFLAHNLNMKVVAEGVEKKEQLIFLQSQGCDEFQGAIFSMPVDKEDIQTMLHEDYSQTFKKYFTLKK